MRKINWTRLEDGYAADGKAKAPAHHGDTKSVNVEWTITVCETNWSDTYSVFISIVDKSLGGDINSTDVNVEATSIEDAKAIAQKMLNARIKDGFRENSIYSR